MTFGRYQSAQRLFSPRILVFYLFLGTSSTTIHAIDALFIGFGPEVNGYSRKGAALGVNVVFGMEFDTCFTTGLSTGFSHDLGTVSVWNFQLLFRYYLPWLRSSVPVGGFFVQAESGGILAFEHGENFPTFSAGISAGWRYNLPRNWYIEPAVRFGYPHIWGLGITAGYRFYLKDKREKFPEIEKSADADTDEFYEMEVLAEIEEQEKIEEPKEPVVPPVYLRIPPVYFNANAADFEGLGLGIIENNNYALELVSQILNEFSNYNVVIEGHANPTTPEGRARRAEEPLLLRVSEARAQWAFDELVRRGIDPDRLHTVGLGTSRTIIPYTDYRNAWQNRRVVFILIREPLTGENNEE